DWWVGKKPRTEPRQLWSGFRLASETRHHVDDHAAVRLIDHEGAIDDSAPVAGRNRCEPLLHHHRNGLDLFLPPGRQAASAPQLLGEPWRQGTALVILGSHDHSVARDAVV